LTFWPNLGTGIAKEVVPQIAVKFHVLTNGLLSYTVETRGCVCVATVALPFTLKSILRKKKNYGNSKYFTVQKCNLPKENPLKETKIFQNIIPLL